MSEINSSSVDAILDQTDTHYILHMNNNSVKSMNKSVFESSFKEVSKIPLVENSLRCLFLPCLPRL